MHHDAWNSYPSIFAVGHKGAEGILSREVYVEEKIDGSQFSFGLFDGELCARSKGAKLHIEAPEAMFTRAIESVKLLAPKLKDGYCYRCEYLKKPKHNTLAYSRTPKEHLIVFDIGVGLEQYMPYSEKVAEAERIGLEAVPLVFQGRIESQQQFREFLDRESVLGGQKIEGVVIKPVGYDMFGLDKKPIFAKFVSEAFKEIHGVEWKKSNPGPTDVVTAIAESLKTPARWNKAIQHLQERGALEGSPRDIGKLIKETQTDVQRECSDEIREKLFAWAWPQISRMVTYGLPEWYKEHLMKEELNRGN